jgi:hypothetical protein
MSLVGRNVVSEMGKAPSAPSTVVHDCTPLPHGKTASLKDKFGAVLPEFCPVGTVGLVEGCPAGAVWLVEFCPAGTVGVADGWAFNNF